ncbi:hypothetical protein AAFF_G00409220 [Aldrovandia affinis]|uniref:Uncharacterized protein n=1 Tax=Aldrovandia affinis TaxID=143900 RepID=A0AAD7VYE6_9TELE|nr:hypothetical protein AAFF_G00409220 [Aldrovandia affinis]
MDGSACRVLLDKNLRKPTAIASHMEGKSTMILQAQPTNARPTTSEAASTADDESVTPAVTSSSSSLMRSFVSGTEVPSAEVYWQLDVMEKHNYFNSCPGKGDLFRLRFPDSTIASKFTCWDDKAAY